MLTSSGIYFLIYPLSIIIDLIIGILQFYNKETNKWRNLVHSHTFSLDCGQTNGSSYRVTLISNKRTNLYFLRDWLGWFGVTKYLTPATIIDTFRSNWLNPTNFNFDGWGCLSVCLFLSGSWDCHFWITRIGFSTCTNFQVYPTI